LVKKLSKTSYWDRVWKVGRDIERPLQLKKPTVWLVEGDLFHPSFDAELIINAYEVMEAAEQHAFVVLTKYPERIIPVLYGKEGNYYLGGGDYIRNIWHLAVVENQETADNRIPELLKLREVSNGWPVVGVAVEPMLGPVDLLSNDYLGGCINCEVCLDNPRTCINCAQNRKLYWVICGGGKDPLNPSWVRDLRDQCTAAKVSFWFSGWGEWAPMQLRDAPDGKVKVFRELKKLTDPCLAKVGKIAAGRLLDGREWNECPALEYESCN